MDRITLLEKIINYDVDTTKCYIELNKYPFDSEVPLIVMTKEHLRSVLNKFMNNQITAKELEDWANMIELRDDIDYSPEVLNEVIIELANPLVYGKLTTESIKEILKSYDQEPK